jgi:cysteine sulfinate desulfinase/cysteine desulfurase-like protein
MKLRKYPKGMFGGHPSGRRFGSADLPLIRAMRDAYRKLLDAVHTIDWQAEGPGMLLAAATLTAELEAKHRACGEILDLIERTPPSWRP